MKIKELRKKYPKFIYERFDWNIKNNDLEIVFFFALRSFTRRRDFSDIKFNPKIVIQNIDKKRFAGIRKNVIDNLVFHLGLIEIPSYWKAACSPQIEILAGELFSEQLRWWKRLFVDGMGQFYYENKIDWRSKNFLKITAKKAKKPNKISPGKLKDRYLVPFAGGRDSIVTLEGLKKAKKEVALFTVNPIEKIQKTAKVTGIKKQIIARRIIDKKLLSLNKKGYLNGHTPFTSLLSFLSVLCAVLFDFKNIAFSNEKSANEGNATYLKKIINHQWAKSSAFEKMFSVYAKKFLIKDINYFSYLRAYGELEISKILTKYPKYFPFFSSCNAGMKILKGGSLYAKERWCGNCPKCLFVYMSLYPFLNKKDLLDIFDKDVFQNKKLLPIMQALTETEKTKPLECVGTKEEAKKAFNLCFKKAKSQGNVPYLLAKPQ
jgi:UDP-N-acetyl-alpha-D-muramoyl-L-alanyl-L-glutamate epimerase